MKVLWRCNVLLPEIASAAGLSNQVNSAGWIEGFLQGLKNRPEVELGIICPGEEMIKGAFDNVRFWICNKGDYQIVLNDFFAGYSPCVWNGGCRIQLFGCAV